jgi:hypothetical protein
MRTGDQQHDSVSHERGAVAWNSTLQRTVAISKQKAGYQAAAAAA